MQDFQRYIRYALGLALTLMFLLHVGGAYPITALTVIENLAYDTRLKLTLPTLIDSMDGVVAKAYRGVPAATAVDDL